MCVCVECQDHQVSNVTPNPGDVKYQRSIKGYTSAEQVFDYKIINIGIDFKIGQCGANLFVYINITAVKWWIIGGKQVI